MKIIATLLLGVGIIMWPLFVMFGAGGVSPSPGGVFWKIIIIGYAPAAITTIILLWLKKWTEYVWIPFLLLLIVAFSAMLFMLLQFNRTKDATRNSDLTYTQYNLDGVATVAIPASFKQDTQNLISNFYYVEYDKESFTYFFTRDAYNDLGGEQRPVSLGIRFYKHNVQPPQIEEDNFDYMGFKSPSNVVAENINIVNVDSSKSVLINTAPDNTYRIYLAYQHSYLKSEAALKMIQSIIGSLKVESTLETQIKIIGDEYWRQHPKDKIIHDKIEAARSAANEIAHNEILSRYPNQLRNGLKLKYFQSGQLSENEWKVQYQVEKPFVNIEIIVDIVNEKVVSYKEQEFD